MKYPFAPHYPSHSESAKLATDVIPLVAALHQFWLSLQTGEEREETLLSPLSMLRSIASHVCG